MLYLLVFLLGALFARPIRKAMAALAVIALLSLAAFLLWRLAPFLTPGVIAGVVVGVLVTIFGSSLHINYLVERDYERGVEKERDIADKRRVRWW